MINEGLKRSLNALREISSEIYTLEVPIISDDTTIGEFATPILEIPEVQNEFMGRLINRLVFTQITSKMYVNPLRNLEGDRIPLGYAGQDIYINPAQGRQYNVNDFVGLLQKYEADVKVQYLTVNKDLQYVVSASRHKLKQAFVSWEALDDFISNLTQSLYNGAYIDMFRFTKALVSSAYSGGYANVQVVSGISTEAQAKAFMTMARGQFLNFRTPSSEYNAWAKVGGVGNPVVTWTDPEDVVFLIRNDILAFLDVNVLASAFNIDSAKLLGNIMPVDNFDVYSTESGTKIFDGSAILGIMADKSWFKIKEQDMYLDEFYNANNRVWNYYLNVTKMYEFSLFSNAIIYATSLPTPSTSSLTVDSDKVTLAVGDTPSTVNVTVVPSTSEVTVKVSNSNVTATLTSGVLSITGVKAGTSKITLSSNGKIAVVNVTVTPAVNPEEPDEPEEQN